jgi:glucosamine--fructose-6-phosphate aminotransferase (isomerizing)
MCGIIGYIGSKRVVPILIDGLRRLEYRGYDSAGVAVVRDGTIDLRRSAGKLARLEEVIATTPIEGEYGHRAHALGDARAARPKRMPIRIVTAPAGSWSSTTASSRTISTCKQQLQSEGHTFVTETDTEIVAHLVERNEG